MDESRVELANLTWEQAEEVIDSADLLALPCGSTEQHSLHLPLSVDSIRAEELTRDICRRAPEFDLTIAMLPVLTYGYAEHHMPFPGTMTLSAETYQRVVFDLADSVARHGGQRLLIVNCHGGNRAPLRLVSDRIQRELDLPVHHVFWAEFARKRIEERWGDDGGHADAHETSAIELFRPELVRESRKTRHHRRGSHETRQLRYFDDLTEEGGLGDPRDSDASFMAELVEETNERILEGIRTDIDTETDTD